MRVLSRAHGGFPNALRIANVPAGAGGPGHRIR
jgi:hypothetical protein